MYILQFFPIYKPMLWGAETWTISAVSGNDSIIANGKYRGTSLSALTTRFPNEILGEAVAAQYGNKLPLLVKEIDAREALSIQVHPNDELAMARHGKMGKNEMWYVMEADYGSRLSMGFKHAISRSDYAHMVEDGSIEDQLHSAEVYAGDCFYIPAGRVHSIGAGMKIAEIQQTSDVTYRLYDFMRRDAEGNLRELHTAEALDAINFDDITTNPKVNYKDERNSVVELVSSPHFHTQKILFTETIARSYSDDVFHILFCVEGSCACINQADNEAVFLHKGEAVLVPACLGHITLVPENKACVLESRVFFE